MIPSLISSILFARFLQIVNSPLQVPEPDARDQARLARLPLPPFMVDVNKFEVQPPEEIPTVRSTLRAYCTLWIYKSTPRTLIATCMLAFTLSRVSLSSVRREFIGQTKPEASESWRMRSAEEDFFVVSVLWCSLAVS
jgi:hypothetical protein